MPRWIPIALVLCCTTSAYAQKDRVRYRDRAAEKDIDQEGDIVESSGGVEFTGADKKKKFIPAADVYRIEYTTLDALRLDIGKIEGGDGAKDPAKAATFYADKLKSSGTAPEKTKRFLAFREAYWLAKVADAKANPDEFKAEAKKAAEKIAAFNQANGKTWEQWQLGRTAARQAGEVGEWKAAAEIFRKLSAVPDAPAEAKTEAMLSQASMLIRGGFVNEAKTVLADAAKEKGLTAGGKERLAIYQAALPAASRKEIDPNDVNAVANAKAKVTDATRLIEASIASAKEPTTRGIGYAMLGEVHFASGLDRDAMWHYLWVDTVYNQDKDEQILAVSRLVDVFNRLGERDGEKNRSEQFRERLLKVR